MSQPLLSTNVHAAANMMNTLQSNVKHSIPSHQLQQQQLSDSNNSVSRSISNIFPSNIMPIPMNATNTVYVEGIPHDATEREVARMISSILCDSIDLFRPFPGYKSVRLIPREKRPGEKVIFCFADFDNKFQTTLVINTLQVRLASLLTDVQGYRFDKDDILGLQFSYATTNNKYTGSGGN